MEIRIPYGHSYITATLPDQVQIDLINPVLVPAAKKPLEVVKAALADLSGSEGFPALSGAETVAIAVNDITRQVPHQYLLPPLMDWLERLGIADQAITFYIAVGTHPPLKQEDFQKILPPEILNRYKVLSHDSEDKQGLIYLGKTRLGTPVWSNRDYVKADVKIVVGNIEAHQFAGFSGGVKTAAIGLAGFETINHNHTLMIDPDSKIGQYEKNPVRQDIEEIGQKIGIDLALNAILNHKKEIVQVLAGDPVAVMKSGVPISRQVCQVAVTEPYSLLISSPGGHPKDINVYQSQKALSSAVMIFALEVLSL